MNELAQLIDKPGIYDMLPYFYHADPCPEPSLSKSIAHVLLADTPRHAWLQHPRLNPAYVSIQKKIFDRGKAAEALFIGGDAQIVIVDAPDFKTKLAREARDAAYKVDKTPLLRKDFATVQAMAEAARLQLDRHEEAADAFTNGRPQEAIFWLEGETWCRLRLDWRTPGSHVFYDYKTTTSANPEVWQRRAFETGCDVQDAWYRRGIRAVLGIENPKFRFVVQETREPYALSVCEFTPATRAQNDAKAHLALEKWRFCLSNNEWGGWSRYIAHISAPIWEERRFEEEKARDQQLRDLGRDPLRAMIDWQAPNAPSAPTIEEHVL